MELMHRKLRFSGERSFNLYHLCYYLSKSAYWDKDRRLVLDFKKYEEPAVKHFIVEALKGLEYFEINNRCLIVRALRAKELRFGDYGDVALDRLGASLA